MIHNDWTEGGLSLQIDTEETTTSSSYTTLATPDTIPDVNVKSGILIVGYRALVKASSGYGSAQLYLNGDAVQIPKAADAPADSGTVWDGLNHWRTLVSDSRFGLSAIVSARTDDASFTDGMILGMSDFYTESDETGYGGFVCLEVDPGTYDVSVKYSRIAGAGTIYAKQRKLWVSTPKFTAI